ncbi:hypothetical protein [Mesorhizobium caraganae]|uniref:hypothetical protein n=1 Tax=Mesorhizobium caraganae TaxID=483206 RepID=UPI0017855045|nr:hypothetical protein [Mesorhizobium caraganae]
MLLLNYRDAMLSNVIKACSTEQSCILHRLENLLVPGNPVRLAIGRRGRIGIADVDRARDLFDQTGIGKGIAA